MNTNAKVVKRFFKLSVLPKYVITTIKGNKHYVSLHLV